MTDQVSIQQVNNFTTPYTTEVLERAIKCLDGIDHLNPPDVRQPAIREYCYWFLLMPQEFQSLARKLYSAGMVA